jgi:hypothetical protein
MIVRISLLLLFVYVTGCASHVTFQVVDAETNLPLAGATVTAEYEPIWIGYLAQIPIDPKVGKADSKGFVSMWLSKPDGITTACEGYLPYWGITFKEVPSWPFKFATLHLYAEPAPQVVLIVPDGYLGPIEVREHFPSLVKSGGRRYFEFRVVPGEVVDLKNVPPHSNYDSITFTSCRYASGQLISEEPENHFDWHGPGSDEIAVRRVSDDLVRQGRAESVVVTYVIGTYADWIDMRAKLDLPIPRFPTTRRR